MASLRAAKVTAGRRTYNPASSEHDEQVTVVQWARINAIYWPELKYLFAIPNGAKLPYGVNRKGQRFSPQAARLVDEGLLAGVCDLFLPCARKGFHGLFIELKHGTNTISDEQQWFMEGALSFGYLAMACWEADEAIEAIRDYLGKPIARESL